MATSLKYLKKIFKREDSDRIRRIANTDWHPWTPNIGTQQEAAYNCEADELFYGGAAGSGKSMPAYGMGWCFQNIENFTVDKYHDVIGLVTEEIKLMDATVLMWDGSCKTFSEVEVGDRIMNPNGEMQTILQTHERGELETYLVTFEDATTVECSGDHLWSLCRSDIFTNRNLTSFTPSEWDDYYAPQLIVRDTEWMSQAIKKARLVIPVPAMLKFSQGDRTYLYKRNIVFQNGKQIKTIEKKGIAYCRCITVSNPNGLYITDGYNVTHNSDLILGVAITQHQESIIFRREYPQSKALIRRSKQIIGTDGDFNNTEKVWQNLPGDRLLEFGACQYENDVEKYQGRPHDFIGFDEITHFLRSQYQFLTGWNRSTIQTQRCRIVCTGNPPSTVEGRWVIDYWGPWLNPKYPNPAQPGELRWFIVIEGKDIEVPSGEPYDYQGEIIQPRSRTFIPGRLADNPHLAKTNYWSVLQGLPEPLRSQLLYGRFDIEPETDPWQVIPTDWVNAAVERWTKLPPTRRTHLGVDVARGGKDETIIVVRHGNWIGKIISLPGVATPDGDVIVEEVMKEYVLGCSIHIDVVGVGASPYDTLKRLNKTREKSQRVKVYGLSGGKKSERRDRSGQLGFANQRSEWWWKLREMLDPVNGLAIALPDDSKLIQDLISPKWRRLSNDTIQVESKEELAKANRLGRSPDRGDAVVYAFAVPDDEAANYDVMKALMRG